MLYRARLFILLLAAALAPTASAQSTEYETAVRGVWVTNVASNVLFSKSNIADAMAYLADNGFNVVYPVVWNKGFTLYPSDVMAETFGEAYRQDPFFADQGRDPLADLIVEAHRHGMEVIPWFEYGFAASYADNGGHLLDPSQNPTAKPEWAGIDRNGDLVEKNGFEWMNALNPEVQAFMLSLIEEVITTYDVDGVQGDDRLPAFPVEGGYSEVSKELYRAEHDGADPPGLPTDPSFRAWKAAKLTTFAGRLYRLVKDHDPNLFVSLSPSVYDFSLREYLQDWPTWLDSSYVDLLHPQVYRNDVTSYRSTLDQTRSYVGPFRQELFAPGILVGVGSGPRNNWSEVKRMVEYNRERGVTGEVYFYYESLGAQNNYVADSLGATFYQTPAILPGRLGIWRPEATIVNETDAERVTRTGTWTETLPFGFEGQMLRADAEADATITYTLPVNYSGTYDVYAYLPSFQGTATTAEARYTIAHAEGSAEVTTPQRQLPGLWTHLATLPFEAGTPAEITLQAAADGRTYADAVMLLLNRKETPDLLLPLPTEDGGDELPAQMQLLGNYPNPFNPATTIRFALPDAAAVQLTVYDALGRRVRTLADGAVLPAGSHAVAADLGGLPTGVYFYRLRAGDVTATRSMLLVK